jgi:hypothetical protein
MTTMSDSEKNLINSRDRISLTRVTTLTDFLNILDTKYLLFRDLEGTISTIHDFTNKYKDYDIYGKNMDTTEKIYTQQISQVIV